MAEGSILTTTKRTLGLAEDYNVFDEEVMLHINSVFSDLTQLGVGPEEGFMIEDENDEWDDFIDDARLNMVKSYMYLRVRLLFDISSLTGPLVEAYERMIQKHEWRMTVAADELATEGAADV